MTSIPCCYKPDDDAEYQCKYRRLPELPMCQWHMHETFRDALWHDRLPVDVWSALVKETDSYLKLKDTAFHFRMGHALKDARRESEERAQQKRADALANSVVYYVRLTGDRIKIGWTSNLEQRLKQFRLRAADILAIEPGDKVTETRRHRQFAHLRIGRSEDFREDAGLMAHIERLKEQAA